MESNQSKKYKWDNNKFSEEEIVADHTEILKKIWDLVLPKTYPYVENFETLFAVEVKKEKYLGPYKMTENKLFYSAKVRLDSQPLIKAGWKGEKVSEEFAKKAYGQQYFFEMREAIRHLAKYAGVDFSNFDMDGDIKAEVEDYKP